MSAHSNHFTSTAASTNNTTHTPTHTYPQCPQSYRRGVKSKGKKRFRFICWRKLVGWSYLTDKTDERLGGEAICVHLSDFVCVGCGMSTNLYGVTNFQTNIFIYNCIFWCTLMCKYVYVIFRVIRRFEKVCDSRSHTRAISHTYMCVRVCVSRAISMLEKLK